MVYCEWDALQKFDQITAEIGPRAMAAKEVVASFQLLQQRQIQQRLMLQNDRLI
jgi:hypothetical protein